MYVHRHASHQSSENALESISNLAEFNLTIGLNQYLSDANQSDFWGVSNRNHYVNSLGNAISAFLESNANDDRANALLLERVFSSMIRESMKFVIVFGIVLLVFGIIALFIPTFTFFTKERVAHAGFFKIDFKKPHTLVINPIVGAVCIAAGIILILI